MEGGALGCVGDRRCRFERRLLSDDGSGGTAAVRLPLPSSALKPDFSKRVRLFLTQRAAFSLAMERSFARATSARLERDGFAASSGWE